MARLLIPPKARWYDELRLVAYYREKDLEASIHQHAKAFFPHHYVFPFKKEVISNSTDEAKAGDLAVIRRDFSEWCVIEIEMYGHGLKHVLEQVRVFKDARYNVPEVAEYVRQQMRQHCNKSASLKRLTALFSSHPPSVLVIADPRAAGWEQPLKDAGAGFCIFEIYKNPAGHHVYRYIGQYPTVPAQEAHCRPHVSYRNLLEVIGNFTFTKLIGDNEVEVIFENYLTRWALLTDDGKNYLRFLGAANPLTPLATYGLFRDRSDNYYFKRN